jgi:dual specificity tyrosine-phosphorylation-regulated kinase 2/3/4
MLQDRDDNLSVIHMYDHFVFRSHVCITFELLGINLYELLRRNHMRGLSTGVVRKMTYCVLQCLNALYRLRVIHCDLKPENIILRQPGSSAVKVSDLSNFDTLIYYLHSSFVKSGNLRVANESKAAKASISGGSN